MTARDWMEQGTKLFLTAVDRLSDEDFDEPTDLPGWSRRHLIAHVHYNAEALRRLVHWAATGEERRMYASREQRAEEIETGARLPAGELRGRVRQSAQALAYDLDALSAEARTREVVTAQGRTVPASEIPWMRAREVAVHTVDLKAGYGFDDLPAGFTAALAVDAVRKRAASGEAAPLAAWLTGRTAQAPTLGPWL
ncbi:maleylpyruvate isomerase [Micromonospora rhizosphaerae]|uniref:Maleylpyruvate isomerase n=1 Tax=Micromonospora rhizosphaerae TaxID=568872 RepID=A0A1C6RTV4_9ACTN|nr:maleylpyruvate isomerase N-terminal domain-containing protein [Micromonospora rhizosphaerae]SCL20437.1 maleylpyruvate isomerase [Micromonospora rhizosphaerae]